MSFPFEPPVDQIPYPPQDIPTPDLGLADFETIGAKIETGKQAAQKAVGWTWPFAKFIGSIVGAILAALLNCLLSLVTYLLAKVFEIFQKGDANMDKLASAALTGMFGLDLPPPSVTTVGKPKQFATVDKALADAIQTGLGKGTTVGSNGSIAPGHLGANNFLAMTAHMAIEGWVQGCLVEIASDNKLERFADLKDTLERAFGFGRLARRALAAPMKILVEDPYTQELNQKYHPTVLGPGELVRYYLRGGIDRPGLQKEMDLHGYNDTYVTQLIYDQLKEPGPQEINVLRDHKAIDDTAALKALQRQGYDATTGQQQLDAMRWQRQEALERRHADEALELYKAHRMTHQEYADEIDLTQLADFEKAQYKKFGDLYSTHYATFGLSEVETLVRKGIWNDSDVNTWATAKDRYTVEDSLTLQQLLDKEVNDARAAALKRAALEADRARRQADADARRAERDRIALMEVESRGVSTAEFETLVNEGLRTPAQYVQYLVDKQVAPDNAASLAQSLGIRQQAKKDAAAARAAARALAHAKKIDLTQLETGVKQGLITLADFTARLVAMGMPIADAALIAQEVQDGIDAANTKAKAVAAAKARAAQRHIDLSQEERAVRLGILDIQAYSAFLDAKGFDATDRDILVSELNDQLATDKQTAAKKAAAQSKATQKGISLNQLERLVRAGIKTVADYQAALQTAGVDQADQDALVQFLQLEMEQDKADLIVHGHAAALVGQLGVSLADLERAVKLSVVPIATYQDALARAGVPDADQQTLVQTLAKQVKTTRQQQSTTQQVSKQVAAAGVNLNTLERDVLRGAISISQFQGLLAGYGVADAQITDVVMLVQDEMANQAAVQALVAQATQRAAAKGLNLAQDTAAYKQGVLSEAEWRSRVASLGYDQADVEILFETLAATQAAAAAKSAKKTTTAPAAPAPAPAPAG